MVARVHRRSLLVVARSVRGRSQAVVARSVPSAHVRCRSQAAAASSVCAGSSAAAVQKPPLPSAQVKLLHTSDVQKPPRVLQVNKITVDLDLGGNTSMFNIFISNNYIEKKYFARIHWSSEAMFAAID
ncbi:uncharacterized protein LOC103503375 isoform X1 [Cucumis melo]|uniref:Uncharacterized protein LOC103503375 isoform X1 n=1 Tax=Cucumis melo TaxID=3656 RepID=A0ABM3L5Z5_CUCME|nr:uncharacterized protein LOC103503375 isoform X1 [Cucumis melo]